MIARLPIEPSRRRFLAGAAASIAGLGVPSSAGAQAAPEAPPRATLITNARLFNGTSPALREGAQALVVGSKIEAVDLARMPAPEGATVIDAGGRVLMPGLIDAHVHMILSTVDLPVLLTADPNFLMLLAGKAAGEMLVRGFTSVRDLGGPVFGLKQAIDKGALPGPRIWPAGATISQTSGHGDYRSHHDLPRVDGASLHFTERLGMTAIADGTDEVLRRVREQLFLGASHIKLMAGGGVVSIHDPLDTAQYTEAEIRAAVEAAAAWNTYVTVHAYMPAAISTAIRAGVRCVEHGHLADEATARLMAERGVWWSLQPFLDDEDAIPPGKPGYDKEQEVIAGTEIAYGLAKRHGIPTAFGTDILFSAQRAARQGAQLVKLRRWYTPAQALTMATADNARLLALSGPRNPYPGRLGVIESGGLADLLVVDGEPLDDLAPLADPARNLRIIMKDGVIYKNSL